MRKKLRDSQPATTVIDHIRELQKRLFVSVIALIVAGIAVYLFYEPILTLLRSPLDAPLYYTSPAGSFAFVMKICLMGALAVTIPVIIYNIIMFVRPAFIAALPLRRVYLTTLFSAGLALAGAAFGFFFIIPGALHFFAGFQVDGLSALISADSYLGFVTNAIITFIILFQLPLVIAFIDTIKPLKPQSLFKAEKWVILGSLVISFLVPFALDLTTSLLIALPIIALYNLSIVIVVARHSQAKRRILAAERSMQNVARIPSSDLSLSDISFESLLGELPVTPVVQAQPVLVAAPAAIISKDRRPGMDIRPRQVKPAPVAPAPWVHRVHEQIAPNPRARIISDMAPRRVNA